MPHSALLQIIKLIPDGKISACKKYIDYAGGKHRKVYRKMLDHHWKHRPHFSSEELEPNRLAEQFFDGNIRELHVRSTQMKKIIEQFLVVQMLREPKNELHPRGQLLLLEHVHPDYQLFQNRSLQLVNQLKEQRPVPTKVFNDLHRINAELFYHPGTDRFNGDIPYLEEAAAHLDIYFLISKLRLILENRHRRRIHQGIAPLESVLETLALAEHYHQVPAIELYLDLIEAFEGEFSTEAFCRIKDRYQENFDLLQEFEQKNVLNKLFYLANTAYERGRMAFNRERLSLYKFGDEKGLFLHKDMMSPITYVNIVLLALSLHDFKWADSVRDRYKEVLPEHERSGYVELIKAYEAYFKSEPEIASGILGSLRNKGGLNFFIDLHTRILLIWTGFDTLDPQATDPVYLNYQIDNLIAFIKNRSELHPNRKEAFLNMAKAMRKLKRLKLERDTAMIARRSGRLRRFLEETEQVFSRPWLLKQLESFERR